MTDFVVICFQIVLYLSSYTTRLDKSLTGAVFELENRMKKWVLLPIFSFLAVALKHF